MCVIIKGYDVIVLESVSMFLFLSITLNALDVPALQMSPKTPSYLGDRSSKSHIMTTFYRPSLNTQGLVDKKTAKHFQGHCKMLINFDLPFVSNSPFGR